MILFKSGKTDLKRIFLFNTLLLLQKCVGAQPLRGVMTVDRELSREAAPARGNDRTMRFLRGYAP